MVYRQVSSTRHHEHILRLVVRKAGFSLQGLLVIATRALILSRHVLVQGITMFSSLPTPSGEGPSSLLVQLSGVYLMAAARSQAIGWAAVALSGLVQAGLGQGLRLFHPIAAGPARF